MPAKNADHKWLKGSFGCVLDKKGKTITVYGISQELLKLQHHVIYQMKGQISLHVLLYICFLDEVGFDEKSNLKPMFSLYFLNSDISLIVEITVIHFYTDVNIIHIEGTVSQIFYLRLVFILFEKTGNFYVFLKLYFLDSIKQNLRPELKF